MCTIGTVFHQQRAVNDCFRQCDLPVPAQPCFTQASAVFALAGALGQLRIPAQWLHRFPLIKAVFGAARARNNRLLAEASAAPASSTIL